MPQEGFKEGVMPHRVSYTVYYEDTDALGVVYYANYFKFMERGRTELIASTGRSIAQWNAAGFLFVVHEVNAKFRQPARLGDRLQVVTDLQVSSPYRGRFTQRVERDATLLVDAAVDVVCLDAQGSLVEFPQQLRDAPGGAADRL